MPPEAGGDVRRNTINSGEVWTATQTSGRQTLSALQPLRCLLYSRRLSTSRIGSPLGRGVEQMRRGS